jgi:hypothetical protein
MELFAFRENLAFWVFMFILECSSLDKQGKIGWGFGDGVDVTVDDNDVMHRIQLYCSVVNRRLTKSSLFAKILITVTGTITNFLSSLRALLPNAFPKKFLNNLNLDTPEISVMPDLKQFNCAFGNRREDIRGHTTADPKDLFNFARKQA